MISSVNSFKSLIYGIMNIYESQMNCEWYFIVQIWYIIPVLVEIVNCAKILNYAIIHVHFTKL